MLRSVFCVFFLLAYHTQALAQSKDYSIAPVPGWVQTIAPDDAAKAPDQQISKGIYYLITDNQVRVDGRERTIYRHFATKAVTRQGVESIANIDIEFDPSYQKLILHTVNVRRDGQVISKLRNASIRVLQRERELEALILDGSKTASILLSDIRVGDIVEYAYSVKGVNPVFGQRHFGSFDMQWAVPVARIYARLVWPKGRELFFQHHNKAAAAQVVETATHTEYRWDLPNVAALKTESDTPAWFDPYPFVQWGEFKDWGAVAQWALALYKLPEKTSPNVQAEAAKIARQFTGADQQLVEVLRFVQREVRYLGIEVGTSSHAPSPPALVLERRFGDCKDKSLLTIALLRALGIEAAPALVHTKLRSGIETWQPSPSSFNHVVVRARVNGKDVWIDPTRSPQPGDLSHLVEVDYGPALVISPGTTALTPMAGDKALLLLRRLHIAIDASEGYDKPVRYIATTTVQGAAANSLRATLSSTSKDELQKRYLNYYARYYPGLVQAAPLEIKEEDDSNRITLVENYQIKDFWLRSKDGLHLESTLETPELRDYLRQPNSTVRESPLSLLHPVDIEHTTEVLLPGKWDMEPSNTQVTDEAFEFRRDQAWNDNKLVLKDRYLTRLNHIQPADVGRYSANLDKARQATIYTLSRSTAAPTAPAANNQPYWAAIVVGFTAVLCFIALARRFYRWDPEPWPALQPYDSTLQGLGGWLVVVFISLVVSSSRSFMTIAEILPNYQTDTWLNVTSSTSEAYHPMWAPIMAFELVANIGLVVWLGLTFVLFFKRRSSLPRNIIALWFYSIFILTVDLFLALCIPAIAPKVTTKDWGDLVKISVAYAAWSLYFLKSKRVRQTFSRRYQLSPTINQEPPIAPVAQR